MPACSWRTPMASRSARCASWTASPAHRGLTEDQAGALAALGRQVVTLLDLQRERSRFEAVFNSAVDYAIIVMNRDGKII